MRFKIDWASLIVGSKFTVLLCLGGLYLGLRFNGVFFALPVWGGGGAYIWRGLFSEFNGISIAPLMNQDKVLGGRTF